MKRIHKTLPLLLLFFFLSVSVSAEDKLLFQHKDTWLMNIISEYEKAKEQVTSRLQECYALEEKIKGIVKRAQEAKDLQAEQTAVKALKSVRNSIIKYKKKTADINATIAHLNNIRTNLSFSNAKDLHYLVAEYEGDVRYYSASEKREFTLTNDSNRQPKPGDTIITGKDGKAKLFMFYQDAKEGPASVVIGNNSKLTLEKVKKGISAFGKVRLFVKKGKLYLEEKIKDYYSKTFVVGTVTKESRKKRNQAIEEWEKCVQTYGIDYEHCRLLYNMIPSAFITPSCVAGIRGTEFIVIEDELKGTEVFVLKGSILIGNREGNRVEIVNANHSIRVSPQGEFFPIQEIDLSKIAKWWQE